MIAIQKIKVLINKFKTELNKKFEIKYNFIERFIFFNLSIAIIFYKQFYLRFLMD